MRLRIKTIPDRVASARAQLAPNAGNILLFGGASSGWSYAAVGFGPLANVGDVIDFEPAGTTFQGFDRMQLERLVEVTLTGPIDAKFTHVGLRPYSAAAAGTVIVDLPMDAANWGKNQGLLTISNYYGAP